MKLLESQELTKVAGGKWVGHEAEYSYISISPNETHTSDAMGVVFSTGGLTDLNGNLVLPFKPGYYEFNGYNIEMSCDFSNYGSYYDYLITPNIY